jgi:tRNA (pseudouridine54-N1)-methyltransferase
MREFIILALKARTTPDFKLTELKDAGRIDLLCRCISNAIFISGGIRRNTIVHCVLTGPRSPPKLISFWGENLKGLEPDELTIARFIKRALERGTKLRLSEEAKVSLGIRISKRSFESLVKEKARGQLIYLHPEGEDIRRFEFEQNPTFVLGDHIGLPRKTEKLLDRLGARRISLGPIELFTSHCIIIVHNELDRRRFES